jgi:LuxR family transcriptional regulator, regulator of acetate metabolism
MGAQSITPDLSRPLRDGLVRLRKQTGVDGSMGGLVGQGGHNLVITENHHMIVNAFQGTVVAPGAGLGGRALQLARPVAVNDYLRAAVISHQFDSQVVRERIHGGIAVPVRVGGRTRALIYGLTRSPQTVGDRALETAGAVGRLLAGDLAVEIEVARRLAGLREERRAAAERALDPREVCEELLSIAAATSDHVVRERLALVCDRLSPAHRSDRCPAGLAPRERDVLGLIAVGKTNSEVAQELALMPTTVKSYLQSAMRKLGTRNRVETVRAALRMGLIR